MGKITIPEECFELNLGESMTAREAELEIVNMTSNN